MRNCNFILIPFFLFSLTANCNYPDYQLENMRNTKEEILQEALVYAKNKNGNDFEKIVLSRKEHNEMFWNHVGEKFTSDVGMTPDLAFEHMSLESLIAWRELMKKLDDHKKISFEKVECKAPSEKYGPFTLIRGCISTLYDEDKKETFTDSKIRTLIEYKGKYKVYNLKRD